MTTSRGIFRDRDGDGDVTKEEIWLNLMEVGWMRTVGQPVVSGIVAGLGMTAALAAMFNLMYEVGLHQDEMLYRDSWMVGCMVGGLWIVLEMYSIRTNQLDEEYHRGYDACKKDYDEEYAAKTAQLNVEIDRLRREVSKANTFKASGAALTGNAFLDLPDKDSELDADPFNDNDRAIEQGCLLMINELYREGNSIARQQMMDRHGMKKRMYETCREELIAVGVINYDGKKIARKLATVSEADIALSKEMDRKRTMRSTGGTPGWK